jgi:hypothetical protein
MFNGKTHYKWQFSIANCYSSLPEGNLVFVFYPMKSHRIIPSKSTMFTQIAATKSLVLRLCFITVCGAIPQQAKFLAVWSNHGA